MQSLDLFTLLFGAIAESFGRTLRGLFFIVIGIIVCVMTVTLNAVLFSEFLPLVDEGLSPESIINGVKEILSFKFGVIFFLTLVMVALGMFANVRSINMNFAFVSLMTGGALLALLVSVILGVELNSSIWWLLAIFILSIFQITRQFQIINTRRWEAYLESIRENNKQLRLKRLQDQTQYINRMEENG